MNVFRTFATANLLGAGLLLVPATLALPAMAQTSPAQTSTQTNSQSTTTSTDPAQGNAAPAAENQALPTQPQTESGQPQNGQGQTTQTMSPQTETAPEQTQTQTNNNGQQMNNEQQSAPMGNGSNGASQQPYQGQDHDNIQTSTSAGKEPTKTQYTREQLVTSTVHQAWLLSGKNEANFVEMVEQIADISAHNRGVKLPDSAAEGRRMGEYIKQRARQDTDELLYAIVDKAVLNATTDSTSHAGSASGHHTGTSRTTHTTHTTTTTESTQPQQ